MFSQHGRFIVLLENIMIRGSLILTAKVICALLLAYPAQLSAEPQPQQPSSLPPELLEQQPDKEVEKEEEESGVLTIEEIVNSLVVSASNREESSLRAPAWVITITQEDFAKRGYFELSDVLDDLPSMDIIRTYGDPYFKNYWRGYRKLLGSPYLLMIDGVTFNHLWLNETTIMAAMPLSNIERIEVLYGPASAVYGPNAAMGVINVVTKSDHKTTTTKVRSTAAIRSPTESYNKISHMTDVVDASVFHKSSAFRASIATRFASGVLDPNIGERFEWTKDKYFSDRQLWGDFVDRPALGGSFNSPIEQRGIDARLYLKNTEIAAQYFSLRVGTGTSFAADKLQSRAIYALTERSAYLRHNQEFGDALVSKTLIRYRESDVDSPTISLERDPVENTVNLSYWLSLNRSFSLLQDFRFIAGQNLIDTGDELLISSGLNYERRDLERAYRKAGDEQPWWDPNIPFSGDPSGVSYEFPIPESKDPVLENRNKLDAIGLYLLARYNFLSDHSIDVGGRLDYNQLLDTLEPTFRGGYIGQFIDQLTVKLLYGQAIQEPTWRELFGAWSGTGSNPGLKSERSQSVELSLSYQIGWLFTQANSFFIEYEDAIINTSAQNIGTRRIFGADFGIQALPPVPGIQQLKIWAYYSPLFYAKQTESETSASLVDVGDLAAHKIIAGATATLNEQLGASLFGRCASARKPVSTNPSAFDTTCTLDANIFLTDLLVDGMSLNLRGTNLLDSRNFHPGVGEADSGETPGRWEGNTWVGSGTTGGYSGYYNSKLPQPGRAITLSLRLDI
ncbi:MAG: TonB-dependent receptor [Myxococcota bacterium]|nr:TonB-dependent receptor [Myxococcota bacterium]